MPQGAIIAVISSYDNQLRRRHRESPTGSRELPPDALRTGDEISMFGRDSAGERYADAIRAEDKRGGWWR